MYIRVVDRKWGTFEGILLIIFGFLAIAFPLITTFSVTIFFGLMFSIAGALVVIRSIKYRKRADFWLSLILGLLIFLIGLTIMCKPLVGLFTLSGLLFITFVAQAVANLVAASKVSEQKGWLYFHAFILFILAGLLWSGWPTTAVWFISFLLGANFIFSGFALLMVSSK